MASGDELSQVAERYERFAAIEANRSSPHCELLAGHVPRSAELLHFHMKLPFARRVARDDGHPLTTFAGDTGTAIHDILLTRTTHTNEPARCAALLPALAQLPQPVARLEAAASAGPCQLPDHDGYENGHGQVGAARPVHPLVRISPRGMRLLASTTAHPARR